jgi:nicotinamidase-related amidase
MNWIMCLLALSLFAGPVFCAAENSQPEKPPVDATIFEHCAFVSIDIQEGARPAPMTLDQVPALWREMGFTADDVNAANDFAWDVALPNAVKVANTCRSLGLPMIFVHWGFRFEDGMDLDPDIRKSMLKEHGTDYAKWSGHIDQPGSQPAKILDIRDGEYVLPKTAQDAFGSSSIDFVLRNLGITNIVFVGGHTGACLGKTAKSAKRLGYTTLCIQDATSNARESTRKQEIVDTGYDYVLTTAEFSELAQSSASQDTGRP